MERACEIRVLAGTTQRRRCLCEENGSYAALRLSRRRTVQGRPLPPADVSYPVAQVGWRLSGGEIARLTGASRPTAAVQRCRKRPHLRATVPLATLPRSGRSWPSAVGHKPSFDLGRPSGRCQRRPRTGSPGHVPVRRQRPQCTRPAGSSGNPTLTHRTRSTGLFRPGLEYAVNVPIRGKAIPPFRPVRSNFCPLKGVL